MCGYYGEPQVSEPIEVNPAWRRNGGLALVCEKCLNVRFPEDFPEHAGDERLKLREWLKDRLKREGYWGPIRASGTTCLDVCAKGRVTIFLPCDPLPQPVGRVSTTVIPPAELATIVHLGFNTEVDRTYGALAAYVTQHELAAAGPIHEYYLVGSSDTRDDSLWRTEVGWPIFQTRQTRQLRN